jgi:hypothetical protein
LIAIDALSLAVVTALVHFFIGAALLRFCASTFTLTLFARLETICVATAATVDERLALAFICVEVPSWHPGKTTAVLRWQATLSHLVPLFPVTTFALFLTLFARIETILVAAAAAEDEHFAAAFASVVVPSRHVGLARSRLRRQQTRIRHVRLITVGCFTF